MIKLVDYTEGERYANSYRNSQIYEVRYFYTIVRMLIPHSGIQISDVSQHLNKCYRRNRIN